MNLIEMIEKTGHLPSKGTLADGTEIELFIRQMTGDKGYRATMFTIVDGLPKNIIDSSTGPTVAKAKENLKESLLKCKETLLNN